MKKEPEYFHENSPKNAGKNISEEIQTINIDEEDEPEAVVFKFFRCPMCKNYKHPQKSAVEIHIMKSHNITKEMLIMMVQGGMIKIKEEAF